VSSGRLFNIEIVPINAELDGSSGDPTSFYVLAPKKSIRVHASSPQLDAGTHSFVAHAELARVSNGSTEVIGTADSEVVTTTLSATSPISR